MKSIHKLIFGLCLCLVAMVIPIHTTMAYSNNDSLIQEIAEVEVLALIDDESIHFESFDYLMQVSANAEHDDHAIAVRHLDRLDKARSNADHLIDAYLISTQSVPLNPAPPLVEKISNDLTVYYLYQRRMRERVPDAIHTQYKASLDSLRELQKGFIRAADHPRPDANQIRVNKQKSDRLFTSENLQGY